MEYFKLSNGKSIPVIGIGPGGCYYKSMHVNENATYISKMIAKVHDHLVYQNVARKYSIEVSNALKSGFRLIDYSASYGTGVPIKNAIRLSGIDRKEFFITTRISNEAQFNKTIKKEFFSQLEGLGVDYVDLLQFHWPVSGFYIDTWKEMLDLYKKGYCKSIGVANCNIHHLEELFKVSDIIPEVNQFEVHPLFTQKELVSYCKSKGIMVEAYTAIARMDDRLMRLPKLKNIAKKYGKSTVQVVIRWHIQQGRIPIVRSLNKDRQKQNINVFDFNLTDEELNIIDSFNINSRLRYDPDNCDFSVL